jgi:hypothetical protein
MSDITITLDYDPVRESHLAKAKRQDDYPNSEISKWDLTGNPITVTGSPKAIRWVYDYLNHLDETYQQDREDFKANIARRAAETIWQRVGDDLPDKQRQ